MSARIALDERHDDPRIGRARPGDEVRIGAAIGHVNEPRWLWARLVGIIHDRTPRPYLLREYRPGDGWYPTGDLLRTSIIGLVPWEGA